MQNKDILYAQNWFEQFRGNVEDTNVDRNHLACYSVPDLLSRFDDLSDVIHWAFTWASTQQNSCWVWSRRQDNLERNARLIR